MSHLGLIDISSSSPIPCHEEDADSIQTGHKEYATVWREFYSWEPQYCHDTIASLRAIECQHPHPVSQVTTCSDPFTSSPSAEQCTVTSFDTNGHVTNHKTTFALATLGLPRRPIPTLPRYTFCTPLSRSVRHHNDNSNLDAVSFLPFADDPEFDIIAYLRGFNHVQWQNRNSPVNFNNPDLDMMEVEVARRLHFKAQLEFASIDAMHLFFNRSCFDFCGSENDFVRLCDKNKSDLIWLSNQRDHLNWPHISQEELEDFSSNNIPVESTLFEDVNQGTLKFCPNLNCLHHFCTVHDFETPPFNHFKPRKTNDEIQLQKGDPCGTLCFRSFLDSGIHLECFHFSEDAATLASSVLNLDPDICPCDLSVICRMPCREVFAFRVQKFPDSAIATRYIEDEEEGPGKADRSCTFSNWLPTTAPCMCVDESSCKDCSDCPCNQSHLFCERNCRCQSQCLLRFPGCKCQDGCDSDFCLCYQHQRECDPEKCVECNARGDPSIICQGDKCQNVQIQRGMPQPIEIKDAQKYGWGVFATKQIAKNRLIGEYCGEILTSHEGCQDEPIVAYRKLNYHFDLLEKQDGQVVNSHFLGNETRCLNHACEGSEENDDVFEDCNCKAIMHIVNGEPRLTIITARIIKKGEELLFDYGKRYWDKVDSGVLEI